MYFLWFLSFLHFISTKVIIPFITIKENFTKNYDPSIFMFHYFPNKIETTIKLGTPTQEISLRIKTFTAPISVNSVQMGTYQITRFNESNSSSFISLNDKPLYYGEYDFKSALKSKEILCLNDDLKLNNFTFFLGITESLYYRESGVLGLNYPDLDMRIKDVSFIKQLKERKLIDKYIFYITYNDNNDTGKVIFGSLPHDIDPQKYDQNKYDEFYATIVRSTLGLTARESYYGDVFIDSAFNIELAIEDNFIRGTKIFRTILEENFFQKYIDRNICKSEIFSYIDNKNQLFFHCSKEVNLTDFKSIILSIDNSELKIELNASDLFLEYNDNYYFMMYFPTGDYTSEYFRLSKIFFKKYIITFNFDNKMIGYYKNKEANNNGKQNINNSDGEYNYLIPWIIIVILVIIVLSLCFYIIYYKLCKNRVKRANELKDDYSYEGMINE